MEACELLALSSSTASHALPRGAAEGCRLRQQMQWELGVLGLAGAGAEFEGLAAPHSTAMDLETFAFHAQVRASTLSVSMHTEPTLVLPPQQACGAGDSATATLRSHAAPCMRSSSCSHIPIFSHCASCGWSSFSGFYWTPLLCLFSTWLRRPCWWRLPGQAWATTVFRFACSILHKCRVEFVCSACSLWRLWCDERTKTSQCLGDDI